MAGATVLGRGGGVCAQMSLFAAPWTEACQASLSVEFFSGKNTGVGCHFLLQEIFLTQGSNPHILSLLHWQVGSLLAPGQKRPKVDSGITKTATMGRDKLDT